MTCAIAAAWSRCASSYPTSEPRPIAASWTINWLQQVNPEVELITKGVAGERPVAGFDCVVAERACGRVGVVLLHRACEQLQAFVSPPSLRQPRRLCARRRTAAVQVCACAVGFVIGGARVDGHSSSAAVDRSATYSDH